MSTPTKESTLVGQIKRALEEAYGDALVLWKIHGGPMQVAGIPDLVGSLYGMMLALEVKLPRPGETTKTARARATVAQRAMLMDLRATGAIAAVVLSVEEAKSLCRLASEVDESDPSANLAWRWEHWAEQPFA